MQHRLELRFFFKFGIAPLAIFPYSKRLYFQVVQNSEDSASRYPLEAQAASRSRHSRWHALQAGQRSALARLA